MTLGESDGEGGVDEFAFGFGLADGGVSVEPKLLERFCSSIEFIHSSSSFSAVIAFDLAFNLEGLLSNDELFGMFCLLLVRVSVNLFASNVWY